MNFEAWKLISRQTAEKLRAIQKEVDFVIILWGDCSILLGVFGAFYLSDTRVGLVSLDGHRDYRGPSSSSTAEPADFELAILTGRRLREPTGPFGSSPLLQATDAVVGGYREPDLIAESKIHHFDRRTFLKTGAQVAANKALALLGHLDRLWLHFDFDVLDPANMPVLFPEPNGLYYQLQIRDLNRRRIYKTDYIKDTDGAIERIYVSGAFGIWQFDKIK